MSNKSTAEAGKMTAELDPKRTEKIVRMVKQELRNQVDGTQLIKYLSNKERYESISHLIRIVETWLKDERYSPYIDKKELESLISEAKSFAETIKPA